jgi:hypothetical protein
MDLARNTAFIDGDRGPLPIAGAGGVKLHFRPPSSTGVHHSAMVQALDRLAHPTMRTDASTGC